MSFSKFHSIPIRRPSLYCILHYPSPNLLLSSPVGDCAYSKISLDVASLCMPNNVADLRICLHPLGTRRANSEKLQVIAVNNKQIAALGLELRNSRQEHQLQLQNHAETDEDSKKELLVRLYCQFVSLMATV